MPEGEAPSRGGEARGSDAVAKGAFDSSRGDKKGAGLARAVFSGAAGEERGDGLAAEVAT
jgi:hypothetical protein